MDFIGEVAAWIGAATGVVSLIWQIASWGRSQHRVSLEVAWGYPVNPNFDFEENYANRMIVCTIINHGSQPVDVVNWTIEFANGRSAYMAQRHPLDVPLPFRLENASRLSLHASVVELLDAANQNEVPVGEGNKILVKLATGKTIRSKSFSLKN